MEIFNFLKHKKMLYSSKEAGYFSYNLMSNLLILNYHG